MYIKRIVLQNVRSFRGVHEFQFGAGLNFLIGENNSGKSTIFEAIQFLVGGRGEREGFGSSGISEPHRVEIVLGGQDLLEVLKAEKYEKLRQFAHEDEYDGEVILRLDRSSETRVCFQANRSVNIDVKKVCFWNPATSQFENVTGIDALAKVLCDYVLVSAELDPSDQLDFGGTKIMGKLLADSASTFQQSPIWETFREAHAQAFGSVGEDSLAQLSASLSTDLTKLVQEQFGSGTLRLDFKLPDAASFIKSGVVLVDDGFGETPAASKGSGMQRAIAFAAIQLAAQANGNASSNAPIFMLIDEPETWLHPRAQLQLARALAALSVRQQVLLITHSPYLLRHFDPKSCVLHIVRPSGCAIRSDSAAQIGLLGTGEPSWAEINYRAFDVVGVEFHNELYGIVTAHLERLDLYRESDMVEFLQNAGVAESRPWKKRSGSEYSVPLPVFVRNAIHHPENPLASRLTFEDIRAGIEELLGVIASENLVELLGSPSTDPAGS